jgi:16S rRNA (cytidine1402-2'-O)-methyltransferase
LRSFYFGIFALFLFSITVLIFGITSFVYFMKRSSKRSPSRRFLTRAQSLLTSDPHHPYIGHILDNWNNWNSRETYLDDTLDTSVSINLDTNISVDDIDGGEQVFTWLSFEAIPTLAFGAGVLYIVSTPIGHLEDITLRALRTLREVSLIACEDTRTTGVLVRKYEISTPLISYHSHSTSHRVDTIVARLLAGESVALVSDAGTPTISDPGYALVQAALAHGIVVSPIPGASAVLSALVGCGLMTHHFMYLGFLPLKKGRQTLLKSLASKQMTVVIYESLYRIDKTLSDIGAIFGSHHPVVVARELTKLHEEYFRGTIAQALVPESFVRKGEAVVLF